MRKILFFSAIIIVAALALYWFKGRKKVSEDIGAAKNAKELEQKVLSFTIDGRTTKGVKRWHLEGKSAEIIENEIHLNDLRAVAYGEDVTVNLTSDSGIYNRDKGEVILIGNVKVVSDDGSVLITDKAKWSQNTREISSEELIHIKRDNMTAVGMGGMANSYEKTATLKEDVKVEIEPHTKVNSDGPLTINYTDNIAVFSDNVRVEDKDGRLFADKLTIYFNSETKKIGKVVAEGNVKVKKGKSYTLSDKAIYTESTKSAKLIGNPRIIIDPEELKQLEGMGPGKDLVRAASSR